MEKQTAVALFELQVDAFIEGVSECVPDHEAFGLSEDEGYEAVRRVGVQALTERRSA